MVDALLPDWRTMGAPIKTEEAGSSRLYELIRNMEMAKRAAD